MRALAAATTPRYEGEARPVCGVISPIVMVVGVTPFSLAVSAAPGEDDPPAGIDDPDDVGATEELAEELPEELQADTARAALAITAPTATNERLVLKAKLLS